jgi:hypothetical protein
MKEDEMGATRKRWEIRIKFESENW